MKTAPVWEATVDILSFEPHWTTKFSAAIESLSLGVTPDLLCGLENATRASIGVVVSRKWVRFRLWVNYPFNMFFPPANVIDCNHPISCWLGLCALKATRM